MCENCGAPLETGFAGGRVVCEYCGSANHFLPRKEDPVEPLHAARDMDETTRMEMLRRQDGVQPRLPQELAPLVSHGGLAPWKVDEALALWRSTCRELSSSDDYTGAELLYNLTVILSNHYSGIDDHMKERALYESALDVLTLPRHRQIMRGLISRKAARSGDTEAARKWLAPCDPGSVDLETDSSYRVSVAEICTVEEDWDGVLEVLGEDMEDVPVTASLDAKAIVQRANALERRGRLRDAAGQLHAFVTVNGASGRKTLEAISDIYRDAGIEICPRSIPMAMGLHDRDAGLEAARSRNPGCFGQIFAVTGIFVIVLGAVLGPVLELAGGRMPLAALIPLWLMGLAFLAVGVHFILAGRRAARLHTDGIRRRGNVLSATPTGWKINGVPQYSLRVRVEVPEGEPYEVTLKRPIPDGETEAWRPGAEIDLKVDPGDPSRVAVF